MLFTISDVFWWKWNENNIQERYLSALIMVRDNGFDNKHDFISA